jgi:hypothetical protein
VLSCRDCSRRELPVVGREDARASIVGVYCGKECGDCGEGVVVVRERCGSTNLVEEMLFRASSKRGVFGLCGGELAFPTVDRPENICSMPTRICSILEAGRRVVDRVGGDRLVAVCRIGGIAMSIRSTRDPPVPNLILKRMTVFYSGVHQRILFSLPA